MTDVMIHQQLELLHEFGCARKEQFKTVSSILSKMQMGSACLEAQVHYYSAFRAIALGMRIEDILALEYERASTMIGRVNQAYSQEQFDYQLAMIQGIAMSMTKLAPVSHAFLENITKWMTMANMSQFAKGPLALPFSNAKTTFSSGRLNLQHSLREARQNIVAALKAINSAYYKAESAREDYGTVVSVIAEKVCDYHQTRMMQLIADMVSSDLGEDVRPQAEEWKKPVLAGKLLGLSNAITAVLKTLPRTTALLCN